MSRGLSLVQSVVLGFLLSPDAYGAFATALGILMFTAALRAGGVWMVLGAVEPQHYRERGAPIFWVGMIISSVTVLMTLTACIPALGLIKNEGVAASMLVMATQFALMPLQQYAQMKVSGEGRYEALSRTVAITSVVRFGSAVGAALAGWGPLALAVPQVLGTTVEAVCYVRAGGMDRSYFRFDVRAVAVCLRGHLPILPISLLNSVNTQGDYFIGTLFLSTASLGYYMFAYQIASQPYMVLTLALQRVLIPASAKARANPILHSDYLSGMATTVFFVVPAICFGLGVVFPSIERAIWGGKWAASSSLVAILCVGLSGPVALAILITPLLAERKYSIVLITEAIRSVSVLAGGVLGATVIAGMPMFRDHPNRDVIGLALGVCLVTSITSVATAIWLLTVSGLKVKPMLESLASGPAVCVLAAIGAWSVADSLQVSFETMSTRGGAAIVAVATGVLYGLMLLAGLQLLPQLRIAYANIAEPGLRGLRRLALRFNLPFGD